jgi:deferrochelatase/peroxidase EfeB
MGSTRRKFLQSAGLTGLGASALGTGTLLAGGESPVLASTAQASTAQASTAHGVVPFYGEHQAGIATPAQNYLQFASYDMVTDSVADLRTLLRTWTQAAARMSLGQAVGAVRTGSNPPADTGEAEGLPPSRLTVTFGFGPTLFSRNGVDRFGLAARRPAPLVNLPKFRGDAIRSGISGGDICVQVCATDPQVAFHAVHDLNRMALPIVKPRWLLAGFGRTGNSNSQTLPRNLMGFQDGTENILTEETGALRQFVWAKGPASPAWMHGGSYLVARRIQIRLAHWDGSGLDDQQDTIGRFKLSGALLGKLPPSSHVLLASPGRNGGQRILRRGYSYVDGVDPVNEVPAVGVLFLCYQSDPRHQFIPIQRRLAASDALNEYIFHIGSAIFACPPGAKQGGYVGEQLLG